MGCEEVGFAILLRIRLQWRPAFHRLATNFLMLYAAKCRVRDEATNLKTEAMIMHCLVRAIHILEGSDTSVRSNDGIMIKRGKLEDIRRNTSSSTTSPIMNLTPSHQEVKPRQRLATRTTHRSDNVWWYKLSRAELVTWSWLWYAHVTTVVIWLGVGQAQ
jgi:hypothetical protein